ncbi:class I SAM-dependent methyltransferase [uncultured Slackia sp.]|uniref:class I SAM-dependent methyltransferase n=1 Tax=uncultured Slackia sp. TaxID=665903 RepID=UPI0025F73754|nr:class I SAM-dependent methyltransferase [uncultured Slackia sp.]
MSNETAILQSESACSGHVQEGLTFSESAPAAALPDGLDLLETDAGLTLAGDGMTLRADFSEMIPRIKQGRLQQELLVRAAKIKGAEEPLAVDATAGFGQDSLLLAAAGFRVLLFERNPVIAALLRDALRRAASVPELADAIARMCFIEGDSVAALNGMGSVDDGAHAGGALRQPDVVYLDPMFPARTKSAAVKKKFQLLHHLEQPCEDPDAMLHAALAAKPRKIVVKRPPKGPYLANVKPSYSLAGKAVRYDVIVPPRG